MTSPNIPLEEGFLPVGGYEDTYEVSNFGRVKSLVTGKIRALSAAGRGYPMVGLFQNGVNKTKKVHQLVALAFFPNPTGLTEINHKNSIKTDNRVENLEWCDNRYNRNHFHQTKKTASKYPGVTWHRGTRKWQARIKANGIRRYLGVFTDEREAARAYDNAVEELKCKMVR